MYAMIFLLLFISFCSTNPTNETITYTQIEIFNQSFTRTYTCPPHLNCRFLCGTVYNACLNTTFQCNHNNTCILDCTSEASCCFGSFECSGNSSCTLNCSGVRSCNFMREFCGSYNNGNRNVWKGLPPNCISVPYQFHFSSVDATIGLAASVGFASVGYTVENIVIVPDGYVQLLVKSFPDDPEMQSLLFSKIYEVGADVFIQISPPNTDNIWKSFPDIVFNKTHPLIVTASFPHAYQFIVASLSIVFETYSRLVSLENVDYFRHNNTINLELSVAGIGLDVINRIAEMVVRDAFRYPNDSFVKVSSHQVGSTVYSTIQFYDWNCTPPAPFYGAACLGRSWNSFGNQLVLYEDVIASLLEHFGSLIISSLLHILEGTLSTQSNMSISNGVVLIVNSTISVGDTIHVSGTLQIDVSSNISANNIIINEGHEIIIKLDQQHYENYVTTGNITIMPFKANNVSGDFSQITFQGPNGTLGGCASTSHEGNTYLITFSDCNNQISSNTPVLIGSIVGGVLTLAVVISFVYLLVRIYTFQKSMKALEDPQAEPKPNQKSKDTTIQVPNVLNT